MGNTTFTISTSTELIEEIKKHTDNVSSFFNGAVRFQLNQYRTQRQTEFMWYIALPFLGFIGCIGATLFFESIFFFILMAVSGIYLIVFITIYINKYRRRKK